MDANTANPKTVIAEDIEIVGSIKSASDITLSCKLNGDLTCTGNALIGETGVIKGNISANSTSIQGQVNGNISVKDRIELKSTARINGDIRAKRLTVEDGVTFVGKSEVNPNGAPMTKSGPETKADDKDQSKDKDKEVTADDADSKKGMFGRK